MDKHEWKDFENDLLDRGYKKWTSSKHGEEDFDVSRMVKDDSKDMYQLIFRFWDFEKYKEGAGYSVDFVVMPCIDGRMDAICSSMDNGLSKNIEFAEKFAEDYYLFVQNELNNNG